MHKREQKAIKTVEVKLTMRGPNEKQIWRFFTMIPYVKSNGKN